MNMPLVEVLMATYNGERYLRAQISTILAQTHPRVRLVARDDGSRDSTVAILEEFAHDPRVAIHQDGNVGLPSAFFRLIDDSGDDADLWALSDQDDVWQPQKLSRAVAALEGLDVPALYCARVLVVDEDLVPLYPHELPARGPSFANALVQNIALGCTIMINRAARDLLRGRWPKDCVMHDAWMYLVISGCGTVIYDHEPVMLYRQHSQNSVGMARGRASAVLGRVKRQLSPGGAGKHGRQNHELLRIHCEQLLPAARAELATIVSAQETFLGRACYGARGAAHRQTLGSDLVLRALMIVGRL